MMTEPDIPSSANAGRRLKHLDPSYLPIEQFMTIDGLLRSHAAEIEQKPLICYPAHGVSDFERQTAADLNQFVNAAVQHYISNGIEPADPENEHAPVVALLSPSNFDVIVSVFALNRLGWAILFLSTRLTSPAYARLLGLADCDMVILPRSDKSIMQGICEHRSSCTSVPIVERQEYRQRQAPEFDRSTVNLSKEANKIAWILHSSGSTGLPKPIFLTNLQCLANFRKTFGMRAFCTSPLFHSHGLMELFRAFYNQSATYYINFAYPVTSSNLLEALDVAQPELVVVVPYILKLLAERDEGIQALAKAELVLFGGSSCPDDLGDRLVANGVKLAANYGATETGQIMTSFRPMDDDEWQYLRLHRPVADFTLMDEIVPGIFECVALDGLPSKGPSNAIPPFSAKNPPGSFRTADLFARHPDPGKTNYYKYLSRLDDRITLVSGEKVLPISIEGRIRQEALVREAVVFGYQRSVPGVLIFRSNEKGDHLTDEEFLSAIWPAVEAANLQAETFSRIPREMVVIKGADVSYPSTDKRTLIRAQTYLHFADDIDQAYKSFNTESGDTTANKLKLNIRNMEDWLLARFKDDLGVALPSVDTDIFSTGVDSLQTIRIWRSIRRSIDLGKQGEGLSRNIVFEMGTVRHLAEHLVLLGAGDTASQVDDTIQTMSEMIERYSGFTQHPSSEMAWPEKEIVVVTGATGNLGAFVVAALARNPRVEQIWALVRSSGQLTPTARVFQSLSERQINMTNDEMSKIHAISSDVSQPDLGLSQRELEHLLSSMTCMIHSAWAVNFNLGVRSFESQHIRGTYNLINLCLRSRLCQPARFFFCSSVSAVAAIPESSVIPESIVEDLHSARKTGYGRSKLVAEHIIRNAALQTGMHARVLRIGQLSGDTTTANWNDSEAVALMIRSALTVGALPALNDRPSWLPVDVCAKAIVELVLSFSPSEESPVPDGRNDPNLVYNVVNPKTFDWTADLLPALRTSILPDFEVLSPPEWLMKLMESEKDPEKNPSIKLIDFWRSKYFSEEQKAKDVTDQNTFGRIYQTERTVKICPSLGTVKDPVSEGLIQKYVEAWLRKWSSL